MAVHKSLTRAYKPATKGITLIEVAVLLLISTIILIPVLRLTGGNTSTQGNITSVSANASREMVLANNQIERVLGSDLTAINCGGGQLNPAPGGTASCRGVDNVFSNQPIYYEWIVVNKSNNIPSTMNNFLYEVTYNVYSDPAYSTLALSYPFKSFSNTGSPTTSTTRTNLVVVLDVSGSMGAASRGQTSIGGVASPYLKYLYTDPNYPSYRPPRSPNAPWDTTPLNLFNNTELDLTMFKLANDPQTPFDDRFLRPGSLKNFVPGTGCDDPNYYNSVIFTTRNPTGTNRIRNMCNATIDTPGSTDPNSINVRFNSNLSRIEAARSSLIKFLLTVEGDSALRDNIDLGFITFARNIDFKLPARKTGLLEQVDGNFQYPNMRRKFSWINRKGNGNIKASGWTNVWDAVYDGAELAFNQPGTNNNIIFIVGDGQPTRGNCSRGNPTAKGLCMASSNVGGVNDGLGNSLAMGTFPGHPGKTAKVFALGLMAGDTTIGPVFREGFTVPTGGVYQYVDNVGDMDQAFEHMKYAILKEVLLQNSARYGMNF